MSGTAAKSLQGKICLVTGATAGIGEVTARELARMGAQVTVVSRDPQRCAAAVERIRSETANEQVDFIAADLSSQAQVHRLAQEFCRRYSRLDVLVNNAGAWFLRRQESVDGIELTLALNHLGYFLLTLLLLKRLEAGAPSRVINVSSGAHWSARLDFDDLQCRRGYNGWQAYARSKLANLLFTYELARRVEAKGITANALHPGFVGTRFAKNNGPLVSALLSVIYRLFALSPEQGARTSIYLASSPEVEGVTGKYFVNCRPVRSSPASYDRQAAERLWQVSLELAGLPVESRNNPNV